MLQLIQGRDGHKFKAEMEQAWKLRHEIFVEEKQWMDLDKPDQREIDQFDNEHALHMLAWEGSELIGYQRMLPTTQPYLLSSVYPQLCETELPNTPEVWEWTRYAVKKTHRKAGRMLSPLANKLLSAIVEWGMHNSINSVVIEMNPLWMMRLVQLHFRVVPLGIAQKIENEDVLAVQAFFDHRTLTQLQEMRGDALATLPALIQNSG